MRARWVSGEKTYVRTAFHFGLHKTKQVLLIHATRMMDMGVDLSDVVEITGTECTMKLSIYEIMRGFCHTDGQYATKRMYTSHFE